jgi:hypothetical protein
MSARGPKPRTASNSSRKGLIRRPGLEAPSRLSIEAQREYERLLAVLDGKGTLDRVDLAVICECARITAVLDAAHEAAGGKPDLASVKIIGLLTSQRRGLLRELGLTTMPSRTVVRAKGGQSPDADPIGPLIKLAGDTKGSG